MFKAQSFNALIPYLGKTILRTSDWTAASAKKPEHGSKQIKGNLDASGLYASDETNLPI